MAHYAFLDSNGVVTQVIVGKDEGEDGIDWEQYYGQIKGQTCKRTSYNTKANAHAANGQPFRKNYAGIGYVYDPIKDAFIPPKPYPSWSLDQDTCVWVAPIPRPNDGKAYYWDEEANSWVPVKAP
jgi:hypothetical protein